MNSNIPPSPMPPWSRPVQNPVTETFTEDDDAGTLSLTTDTTYLRTATLKGDPADPYVAVLPDGNYKRQVKNLVIPGDIIATTAPWQVTGTFSNFTSLLLNGVGSSATVVWDGHAWQLVGGDAEKQS